MVIIDQCSLSSLNGDLSLNSFRLNGYGHINFEEPKRFESGQTIEFEVENNDEANI